MMKETIEVAYPESLAHTLGLGRQDFISEMKTGAMVKFFELGKISSGTAAKVLGISRIDFLELLARYQVSVFAAYQPRDMHEDLDHA